MLKFLQSTLSTLKFILPLLIMFTQIKAQENIIPEMKPDDIPDIEITRKDYFDGTSLWGYINGGADLYLEYGFKKLLVQEVLIREKKYVINIYQMKDPEAAFGIYSILKYKCLSSDSLLQFSCFTKYQAQCAKQEFYISVINQGGSDEEQKVSKILLSILSNRIKNEYFEVPDVFTLTRFSENIHDLKFMAGTIGLQNGYPDGLNLFDGIKKFSIYMEQFEEDTNYAELALISFSEPEDHEKFFINIGADNTAGLDTIIQSREGKFQFTAIQSDKQVIYIESNSEETASKIFLEVMNALHSDGVVK